MSERDHLQATPEESRAAAEALARRAARLNASAARIEALEAANRRLRTALERISLLKADRVTEAPFIAVRALVTEGEVRAALTSPAPETKAPDPA